MDIVSLLLENGADIAQMRWSPLHRAVALGSANDVAEALQGDDPSTRDRSGLTPFLLACDIGDAGKATMLLGASRIEDRYTARLREPALVVATKKHRLEVVKWLLSMGFPVDEATKTGRTALIAAASLNNPEIVSVLLQAGARTDARSRIAAPQHARRPDGYTECNHEHVETAASSTSSAKVARLLMNAGAELPDFGPRVIRGFTGADLIAKQHVTKETFHQQKHRKFGTRNPEPACCEFWLEAIRGKTGGGRARDQFGVIEYSPPAIWSFDRFGISATELLDGRWVQAAGEHEDHYDLDFCIYSDVFVFDGKGGVQIFTYPRDVFPPTDFHTATLVGEEIILIGNLGYPEDRQPGVTQVLSLSLRDFSISRVDTSGAMPGWISRHRANFTDGKIMISGGQIWTGEDLIGNEALYQLTLGTGEWRKL